MNNNLWLYFSVAAYHELENQRLASSVPTAAGVNSTDILDMNSETTPLAKSVPNLWLLNRRPWKMYD